MHRKPRKHRKADKWIVRGRIVPPESTIPEVILEMMREVLREFIYQEVIYNTEKCADLGLRKEEK